MIKLSVGGCWSDPNARVLNADVLACLAAAALPWSTTGFTIILSLWLIAVIFLMPTFGAWQFVDLLFRPICLSAVAIVFLALIGTTWANVPAQDMLRGIKPVIKLLAIPFLVYHFQNSARGDAVFKAFLASCVLLMGLSWIVLFAPELKLKTVAAAGVPVRNYIDQTQEFALCMIALAPCVVFFYRQRRHALAAASAALILCFFFNITFVVAARTALIYVPVMVIVFAGKYLDRKQSWILLVLFSSVAIAAWFSSPYLRSRVENISTEYELYKQDVPLSAGLRLEYWQKSFSFFVDAPIIGHGTGSIKTMFERDAEGKSGLSAVVIGNPHNQAFAVAVQWGALGMIALYTMWLCHLWFFRGGGFASWIGMLVVIQNICSSVLNSHLFDFQEGWIYVIGVGVAAGMSLRDHEGKKIG
ncbi:O-antigen ligase family protein [Bradyrhizobium sp. I1.7.5]|uniref:O-antigen ligase family protein n=1 Tax=Bradyrhizobium sp. I1.7.5 TaxID=3156363 RepID=UPI00339A3433